MSGIGSRYSQHSFAQVPDARSARSKFDRSFAVKDAFFFDYLVPIFVDEILPGDTCNVTLHAFARLATQLVPIMDNVFIDYYFFYVPNRLLWTNWERFNGAQDSPGASISYTVPTLTQFSANNPAVDTIYDKMGLPTNVAGSWTCNNALPFRAYNKIFFDWFRDQNLFSSFVPITGDGPDSTGSYSLQKGAKKHDYFTSALPWPQKNLGGAITIPQGTSAPIISNGGSAVYLSGPSQPSSALYGNTGTGLLQMQSYPGASGTISLANPSGMIADLVNMATVPTINALRQAFQIQSLLELDARGGTRYVEILQAHFNVISPDFRLQRAEYLGGGHTTINAHPVAQTAPTSGSAYKGDLASFATSSTAGKGGSVGFTKSFVEHGYVIGLARARADVTYQQGLNRMWSRQTRYDFFWPKLQQIGEQTILNQEIYTQGTGGTGTGDTGVFGYQERYAEYRYKPSEIHGQLRSTYSTPLDFWHMAEDYATLPTLSDTFIRSNTPITRALANTSAPHIIFDAFFSYKHARPMMSYSVPVSLGRF